MTTIMMGKREMVLPAIHITKAFSGSCFQGPRATDQPSYVERGEIEVVVVGGRGEK